MVDAQGQNVAGSPFPTTLGLGVKAFLEPQESCGATELLVSGAGAKSRELQDQDRNPARFQRGGTLGFWWIEVRGDPFAAAAYDSNANLLCERTATKPLR